ncbi:MAG: putative 4-mercaptohistidine N1-methyltransferase [Akkermansiaceae bacterium]|nr:putative 4-mercaptohistidine N1-methyltransferase [Akkermansiaceae bacterium]
MSEVYESRQLLAEYLLFHYGNEEEVLPADGNWPEGMRESLDFAVRTVGHFGDGEVERSLDLGCAVGRSSFELARSSREVLGIDFSSRFIWAAGTLASGGGIPYERLEEGQVTTPLEAKAPAGIDLERVSFAEGDAMNLPDDLGVFDRVHAANLICRLPEPHKLLARLPGLVKSGGEMVLATPATWLEQYTPSGNWPKGQTRDWLVGQLGDDFELTKELEEPFLIRETARKFQWSRSLVTAWKRL